MKVYQKVLCSEKLPTTKLWGFTVKDNSPVIIHPHLLCGIDGTVYNPNDVYWFEEIKVNLESEIILPITERIDWNKEPQQNDPNYLINSLFWKYHKALKTSERNYLIMLSKNEELITDSMK